MYNKYANIRLPNAFIPYPLVLGHSPWLFAFSFCGYLSLIRHVCLLSATRATNMPLPANFFVMATELCLLNGHSEILKYLLSIVVFVNACFSSAAFASARWQWGRCGPSVRYEGVSGTVKFMPSTSLSRSCQAWNYGAYSTLAWGRCEPFTHFFRFFDVYLHVGHGRAGRWYHFHIRRIVFQIRNLRSAWARASSFHFISTIQREPCYPHTLRTINDLCAGHWHSDHFLGLFCEITSGQMLKSLFCLTHYNWCYWADNKIVPIELHVPSWVVST